MLGVITCMHLVMIIAFIGKMTCTALYIRVALINTKILSKRDKAAVKLTAHATVTNLGTHITTFTSNTSAIVIIKMRKQ